MDWVVVVVVVVVKKKIKEVKGSLALSFLLGGCSIKEEGKTFSRGNGVGSM
jgi:hypothetical protein